MTGVYEGLTVIELADRRNQWAGKLLSDGGARVIQVEPIAGSPGRWCGPFADDKPDPDLCIDYWWNNTGKQSAAVDVARPAGRDLLKQLLAKADVFLESTPDWKTYRSFGPTAAAQSGLSLASGLPGKPPAGWGFSYLDVMGGWMGGLSLIQGLLQAKKTGEGCHIDYSVTEGAMSMLGTYMLDY